MKNVDGGAEYYGCFECLPGTVCLDWAIPNVLQLVPSGGVGEGGSLGLSLEFYIGHYGAYFDGKSILGGRTHHDEHAFVVTNQQTKFPKLLEMGLIAFFGVYFSFSVA